MIGVGHGDLRWRITTDGSCVFDASHAKASPLPRRGWGGWAAVIEHGSDGHVLRGREERSTAVRMELLAVTRGLASIPSGEEVVVVTDSTIISLVHQRWKAEAMPTRYAVCPDRLYWFGLAEQFERLRVVIHLLGRCEVNRVHRRAHVIAHAEARSARSVALGHPAPAIPH